MWGFRSLPEEGRKEVSRKAVSHRKIPAVMITVARKPPQSHPTLHDCCRLQPSKSKSRRAVRQEHPQCCAADLKFLSSMLAKLLTFVSSSLRIIRRIPLLGEPESGSPPTSVTSRIFLPKPATKAEKVPLQSFPKRPKQSRECLQAF